MDGDHGGDNRGGDNLPWSCSLGRIPTPTYAMVMSSRLRAAIFFFLGVKDSLPSCILYRAVADAG